MRKVFLSFLGTTNYFPCNYYREGHEPVKNIRFVQEAEVLWHCADWNESDKIIIVTTDQSHEKNWLDNGHIDFKSKEIIPSEGLKSRLMLQKTAAELNELPIPTGKSEQEIWDIFSAVFEQIEEGDELYFDITHAFRSLPLLAMVILNYAKVIKNIQVKAIGYGAMEAIGEGWQVEKMDIKERNVPVFDLLPFDHLLDWSTAIDKFLTAGDASSITKLTVEKSVAYKKQVQRFDQEADGLKKMADLLANFSKTLATCRGKNIVQEADALKKAIVKVKNQELIKPLTPLLVKLENAVADYSGDEVQDGIVAVRWCLEHNLIQQGFTLLEETMFTHILGQSTNEDTGDIARRNLVGMAVHIELLNKQFEDWHEAARQERDLIEAICSWLRPQDDLLKNFKNLSGYRNDLNHAGMNDGPMPAAKFEEKLDECLAAFETQLSS
jgi:CRISPR-associated Csx2 family protein